MLRAPYHGALRRGLSQYRPHDMRAITIGWSLLLLIKDDQQRLDSQSDIPASGEPDGFYAH